MANSAIIFTSLSKIYRQLPRVLAMLWQKAKTLMVCPLAQMKETKKVKRQETFSWQNWFIFD